MATRLQNTDLDFNNAAKPLNVPDPTNPQDVATKAYVDSAVEGLAWKDSVRAASVANINLSSPGATIDGVSMSTSDRFLAKDQSTASQNGLYIWNGAASVATRAPDGSTGAELEQAVVTVEEGTVNAGTTWRQTAVNFTIDSGSNSWSAFGTGVSAATETTAGIAEIATQSETDTGTDDARIVTPLKLKTTTLFPKKYSTTIGDGAATSYVVTHNLNTQNVIVGVHLTASTYDEVSCEVEHTSVNTVTIKVNTAPAAGAYTVTVIG